MKAYRQFYIEFGVLLPFRVEAVLGRMAAAAINALGQALLAVEHRDKKGERRAIEYRILTTDGVEVKLGFEILYGSPARAWIHVSCPVTPTGPDPLVPERTAESIYRAIAQHPELRELIREKKEEEEKKSEEG